MKTETIEAKLDPESKDAGEFPRFRGIELTFGIMPGFRHTTSICIETRDGERLEFIVDTEQLRSALMNVVGMPEVTHA